MKIDWFTFAAQIINFLILVALLKRFLYGPILKAIADREEEIASRFELAEREQSAAQATRHDLQKQLDDLATTRQQLLAEAAEEVERWKQERLGEAHADVSQARSDWFAAVDRERDQLRSNLLTQYRKHALQMARGILECLADADSQTLLVDSFIRQLAAHLASTQSSGTTLVSEARAGEPVTVRSAFELSDGQQSKIADALARAGVERGAIHFRLDDTLISGIEVRTQDQAISWNASDSLEFLEARFSRDLDEMLTLPTEVAANDSVQDARDATTAVESQDVS